MAHLVATEGGKPGADTEEGGHTHQDYQGRVVDVEVVSEPRDEGRISCRLGGGGEGRGGEGRGGEGRGGEGRGGEGRGGEGRGGEGRVENTPCAGLVETDLKTHKSEGSLGHFCVIIMDLQPHNLDHVEVVQTDG